MKKIWKWIIGIVVVLVIIAAVVGVVFLVRNTPNIFAFRFGTAPYNPGLNQPNVPNGGLAPGGPNGGMPRGGYGWRGFMMHRPGPFFGRGFGPYGMIMPFGWGFFLLAGLFRLLIPLAILVLVAILFYQLGKRAGASTAVPATPDPAPSPARGRKVAKS